VAKKTKRRNRTITSTQLANLKKFFKCKGGAESLNRFAQTLRQRARELRKEAQKHLDSAETLEEEALYMLSAAQAGTMNAMGHFVCKLPGSLADDPDA
jgi:hypothetical protein